MIPTRNEYRKIFHREIGKLPGSFLVLPEQSEPILRELFLVHEGFGGVAIRLIPESRSNRGDRGYIR